MSRRSLIVLLIASLAVNALLIGAWAGDHWWGRPKAMQEAGMGRLLDTVPPDARPAVRAELRRHRYELMRALREVRIARRQVRALSDAGVHTSSEREQLDKALGRLREASTQMQTVLHSALLTGLAAAADDHAAHADRAEEDDLAADR